MMNIAFGPVPSRRLGRSLGVNNIPAKICSYSCLYCQVGKTIKLEAERKSFYRVEDILRSVEDKLKRVFDKGESVDYITYVPDGEPTLDVNLGREVKLLRRLGIPLAIITNASLIWREDVREELSEFDLVSVKLDAISRKLWLSVNRPHSSLNLEAILAGVLKFKEEFRGKLITETMFLEGFEYSQESERLAEFLEALKPEIAYIAIPTRPPAEANVKPASESVLNDAFQKISKRGVKVEYLIGYEGDAFSSTGDPERDILSIMSVHPMREDAVRDFLKRTGAPSSLISKLIKEGKIIDLEYEGKTFFMRKLPTRLS